MFITDILLSILIRSHLNAIKIFDPSSEMMCRACLPCFLRKSWPVATATTVFKQHVQLFMRTVCRSWTQVVGMVLQFKRFESNGNKTERVCAPLGKTKTLVEPDYGHIL